MPPYILTTPSSRGLGFAMTRHLLRHTSLPVIATARSEPGRVRESLLEGLNSKSVGGRLDVQKVDVTGGFHVAFVVCFLEREVDEESVSALAAHCASRFPSSEEKREGDGDNYLHLGILLPGILHPEKSPSQLTYDSIHSTLLTNLLAPLLLFKHLSPLLPTKRTTLAAPTTLGPHLAPHATLATLSARVGSVSDNRLGGWYSYRASKAGVNSAVKTFDIWLKGKAGEKAVSVGLHPGTVRTGLSKEFWGSVEKKGGQLLEPEEAAANLVDVLKNLREEQRGRCWDWKGDEVPP
ncbi:MAG: hypothetical protein M1833_006295 [Piccolia ochrophora]|nr:MAG: hypothetical protein M1833_006295 [Piccolia ochrophora]